MTAAAATPPPVSAAKYSARAAFTVDEWITDIVPMARAVFYSEVAAGCIRIVHRGRRTLVPAGEAKRYIKLLATREARKRGARSA